MKTRFAPSLTGYLHLGHVLHMLYVWGVARARGATVLCRIEDHDLGRARPEYEQAVLDDLAWLGFVADEGLSVSGSSDYRQSDCTAHYSKALESLQKQGLVYGCECSRKQILEKQEDGQAELCYPGTCADKGLPLEGNTVRFRVPSGSVFFDDSALGRCHQVPMGQCGDFSLRDRNGLWTYQFCCVCDDLRQGVDLVVRGEDILSSTGRQIQLIQALGGTVPNYYHHSLLCDIHGEKLSKRQHSESIARLRAAGAEPGDVLGRTAYAAGLIAEDTPLTVVEALRQIQ